MSASLTHEHPREGALYQCQTCGVSWMAHAGPQQCPANSSHIYIDWINYETMFRNGTPGD